LRGIIEAIVMRAWSRRGLFALLMWPLSQVAQLVHQFQFALVVLGYKKQTKLAIPVVVVGNVFVGGTGKTPLVIWLVQQLQQAGWKPAVISRGYGANVDIVREVHSDSLASEMGDEPVLIAQQAKCPVMVGRRRSEVAQTLCAQHPNVDVLISDDGLQHYALGRDVEIVMFDARGIGNGWCMPAGPLRESALRRRDFTILNAPEGINVANIADNNEVIYRMQLVPSEVWQLSSPEQCRSLSSFQSQTIFATAGIGHPQRFFNMLETQGIQFQSQALDDHHQFTENSFQKIDAQIILITEKDAVKCRQITALNQDARVWVVPVVAQLEEQFAANLLKMILEKKNGCTST
jgi:tetraacyldisaccharide 4'-kinase